MAEDLVFQAADKFMTFVSLDVCKIHSEPTLMKQTNYLNNFKDYGVCRSKNINVTRWMIWTNFCSTFLGYNQRL